MEKKYGTILKQITRPFTVFIIVLIFANAVALAIFSVIYYTRNLYNEASKIARNAVAEYESYEGLDWMLEYWEEHADEMRHEYDPAVIDDMSRELQERMPEIGELTQVDNDMIAKMDDDTKKLFAELCYSDLSREFDVMKQSYRPLYLYSFKIRGNEMFIFVTGTKDDEKRASEGGDLFELGTIFDYEKGNYYVLDKVLETGQSVRDMDLSWGSGADHSVIHAFEPIIVDGKLRGVVGVSFKSTEMIYQSLRIMLIMLFITLSFYVVMIILVIDHVRKIVVRPIDKEQKILERYENDKDSLSASRDLETIKTNNEIERMAKSFASMVTELDRYMEEIQFVTAEKERIGAELGVATKIQADMLPRIFPAFPDREEFDLYATMTPAKEVGGDFYDFFLVDDDHLALVMADVSGKGVPAALFMVIAKTLIKNRAMLGGSPSEVLSYANDQLCEHNEAELFVTVWMAIIEISTGKGVAANAGHEHPAIKRAGGQWELVEYKHSAAVATMEGIRFREHEFEIHPGDCLYVYTDGVPEATDSSNELYGCDRMLSALNREADADPKKLLENVKYSIDAFVGQAPQFDDITMMCVKYFGAK